MNTLGATVVPVGDAEAELAPVGVGVAPPGPTNTTDKEQNGAPSGKIPISALPAYLHPQDLDENHDGFFDAQEVAKLIESHIADQHSLQRYRKALISSGVLIVILTLSNLAMGVAAGYLTEPLRVSDTKKTLQDTLGEDLATSRNLASSSLDTFFDAGGAKERANKIKEIAFKYGDRDVLSGVSGVEASRTADDVLFSLDVRLDLKTGWVLKVSRASATADAKGEVCRPDSASGVCAAWTEVHVARRARQLGDSEEGPGGVEDGGEVEESGPRRNLWVWRNEYLHHEQRPLYFGEWF